jgi:TnpA family transposase
MLSSKLILTASVRAAVFGLPAEREEALRRYVLSPEDVALARRHRRAHNRLGFAVQLALVRDLGRPLRPDEVPPAALVEVVAEQLGVEPAVFDLYARRDETRREHIGEIIALLGLQAMHQADYRASIMAAAQTAVATERGEPIVRAILEDLKVRRVIVPPPDLIERLALAGRALGTAASLSRSDP